MVRSITALSAGTILVALILTGCCKFCDPRIEYKEVYIPVGTCPVPPAPTKPVLVSMETKSINDPTGIACLDQKQFENITENFGRLMQYSDQCMNYLNVYIDDTNKKNKELLDKQKQK